VWYQHTRESKKEAMHLISSFVNVYMTNYRVHLYTHASLVYTLNRNRNDMHVSKMNPLMQNCKKVNVYTNMAVNNKMQMVLSSFSVMIAISGLVMAAAACNIS